MSEVLQKYLPEHAVSPVFELIKTCGVHLKIVHERQTRHGDYRRNTDGRHQITVNANLNKYRFLITLIHEIAHLVAFEKYGRQIKPHGLEWKHTFATLMLPFIRPEIFPQKILPLLSRHFRNPTASSDSDHLLSIALKEFDAASDQIYVFQLDYGEKFRIKNGKIFVKGHLRVKRIECIEIKTGALYLFNPNVPVEVLPG